MTVVRLNDVRFAYPARPDPVVALDQVSLTLPAAQLVALYGASGSGKSTLLSVIAGLEVANAGSVEVLDTELTKLSQKDRTQFRLENIGMVFQDSCLVSQLTAAENVELVLRARGIKASASEARAALAKLGISELADRRPIDMSGGQRQRVGITRAIAGGRKLVLCDEPTGALDSKNSKLLFDLLRQMVQETKVAVLVATHDPLAMEFADQTWRITDGHIAHE